MEVEPIDFTVLIAAVGCITGLVSLGIEAARFFSERPHVKLRTFDELNNYICGTDQGEVVRCYLNLQILNTGDKHLLLQDVYMKRPGTKKKTGTLVHYSRAFTGMPWKYCDGQEIEEPGQLRLPASIPPGGIFEASLLFVDVPEECYHTEDSFLYPVLCAVFASGRIRELEIQGICTYPDSDLVYCDKNGKQYSMQPEKL